MSSLTHHPPWQISRRTVCLLIHKITPSANALANQKANHSYIKHRHNLHFLSFNNNKSAYQSTYYSAVNCQSSIIDIEDFNRIFTVIFPLKKAKIKSCTYNTCNNAYKNAINKFACVYIVAWCSFKCIAHCKQKT